MSYQSSVGIFAISYQYRVDILAISGPLGLLGVITESRIALKPVLGGIRIVPLQLILINKETHAVVRFTLFPMNW